MPRKKEEYMQGKFLPLHPEKYVGDVKNIVYRSSWEFQLLRQLDENPNVLKYSSEELVIRYYNPVEGRVKRYFPDILVEYLDASGKTRKQLIEIKPTSHLIKPKQTPKKKFYTYLNEVTRWSVNMAKFKAAQDWCKLRGIEFVIVTRDETTQKFRFLPAAKILLG